MTKSANNAARKSTTTKDQKAGSAEGAEVEAANAAKEAEKQAAAVEEEARQAALLDLKGKLTDQLVELSESDKKSAVEARLYWVNVGRLLNEGRNLFAVGNKEPNDVKFGQWIQAQGKPLANMQRPTRAAAIWLANVHDQKPELYALFPTESTGGDPLRRSPRTLKDWVKDQMHAVFNRAFMEADDDMVIPADMAEKADQQAAAGTAITTVQETVARYIEAMEEEVAGAKDAMAKAKSKDEHIKTQEAFNASYDALEAAEGLRKMLDVHTKEELTDYLIGWKPKQQSVAFKDKDVDSAAEHVFALLKSHPQFSAVYEALGSHVEALQGKVDDEAAERAAMEAEANGGAGGDEFAAEKAADAAEFDGIEADSEGDEIEPEDIDGDDDAEFEADVDAEFED